LIPKLSQFVFLGGNLPGLASELNNKKRNYHGFNHCEPNTLAALETGGLISLNIKLMSSRISKELREKRRSHSVSFLVRSI